MRGPLRLLSIQTVLTELSETLLLLMTQHVLHVPGGKAIGVDQLWRTLALQTVTATMAGNSRAVFLPSKLSSKLMLLLASAPMSRGMGLIRVLVAGSDL